MVGATFVRDGPRCWFIPLREVSVISADGNYVRLQWGKERPLLGRSLTALEGKARPAAAFFAPTGSRSSIWSWFATWISAWGGRLQRPIQRRTGDTDFPAASQTIS